MMFVLTFRFPPWTEWRVGKYLEGFGNGFTTGRLKQQERAIMLGTLHANQKTRSNPTVYSPLAQATHVKDQHYDKEKRTQHHRLCHQRCVIRRPLWNRNEFSMCKMQVFPLTRVFTEINPHVKKMSNQLNFLARPGLFCEQEQDRYLFQNRLNRFVLSWLPSSSDGPSSLQDAVGLQSLQWFLQSLLGLTLTLAWLYCLAVILWCCSDLVKVMASCAQMKISKLGFIFTNISTC